MRRKTNRMQLRLLAAAARVHVDLLSTLGDSVKGMLMDCGIDPKAKKGAGGGAPRVEPGAHAVLLKSALLATRATLPGETASAGCCMHSSAGGLKPGWAFFGSETFAFPSPWITPGSCPCPRLALNAA